MKVNIVEAGLQLFPFDETIPFIEVTDEQYELLSDGKMIYKNGRLIETAYINTLRREINELKTNLSSTDYKAIKFAEGEISLEEYSPIRDERKQWRTRINDLETEINTLMNGSIEE